MSYSEKRALPVCGKYKCDSDRRKFFTEYLIWTSDSSWKLGGFSQLILTWNVYL